jgi:hypothetical protein
MRFFVARIASAPDANDHKRFHKDIPTFWATTAKDSTPEAPFDLWVNAPEPPALFHRPIFGVDGGRSAERNTVDPKIAFATDSDRSIADEVSRS